MTLSTSAVAICCSRASASWRVRALTCSCRSARVELAGGAAVGAWLRLGFFVLLCCAFAGLRLMVQRRLTEPFPCVDDHTLPHHEVRRAQQQNSLVIGSYRSFTSQGAAVRLAVCPLHLQERRNIGTAAKTSLRATTGLMHCNK